MISEVATEARGAVLGLSITFSSLAILTFAFGLAPRANHAHHERPVPTRHPPRRG